MQNLKVVSVIEFNDTLLNHKGYFNRDLTNKVYLQYTVSGELRKSGYVAFTRDNAFFGKTREIAVKNFSEYHNTYIVEGSSKINLIKTKLNSSELVKLINKGIFDHYKTNLKFEGYVGNRPSDCIDEFHEDDTWGIDLEINGIIIESVLYVSELEYNEDKLLLSNKLS